MKVNNDFLRGLVEFIRFGKELVIKNIFQLIAFSYGNDGIVIRTEGGYVDFLLNTAILLSGRVKPLRLIV